MIKAINTIFIVFVLFFNALLSLGQVNITGRVSDNKQNLPSVTVLLLSQDSSLVRGVVTDSTGRFIIENVYPGQYMISASMIGYAKFISSRISVSSNDLVVPDVQLAEIATSLNEVEVKAKRQLFDQKIDRLIINLEGSITSSGNTVLEVLQKSPGIVVNRQNNSIAMNGKTGVRVMINNKLLQVPLDVVVQMLDGMNASNIEKIELITSPPSEYDSEGNAGIIHLVTKREEGLGTNGSFGIMVGARWREAFGGNFDITHRSKRFAYFIDYSVSRNHNLHLFETERRSFNNGFVQRVYANSYRENVTIQQNVSAGIEWVLDKKTILNFLFTGYKRNWSLHANTDELHEAALDSVVSTQMKIYESNVWQSATASVGLQRRIGLKSNVDFNIDYLYYHNSNPSTYDNDVFHETHKVSQASKIDLKKNTPIRFLVLKADYQHEASRFFSWETGIKAVTSSLDNNVLVLRNENNVWMTDPAFTSYSTLKERICAAYISTKWRIGAQWQINSGLRYEYTQSSISSPSEKDMINRKYGYLFPGLSLKKAIAPEKDIQFSYSRRITRPTYNDIAPYVFFWGPQTFSAGNTALYPAIADAIAAGYHSKQWIISLQFSQARNEIVTLQPEVDDESGSLTYRSQNLKRLRTVALTNSYTLPVTSWWEVQSSFTIQYQSGKTAHLAKNILMQRYAYNVNIVNAFKLSKDFSIEISGMYQSKALSGISEFLPLGSLNAGIQKGFGNGGVLRLSMDDILNTNYWKIKTNSVSNLDSYFNYKWNNRFVRVTYTRSLGNNKLQSVKLKSGSEEERNRVSN
jgi:outer membrane receptor for ferrienterochelin and colicin